MGTLNARGLSSTAARALVFTTSASVLVLEILAGRIMAPYVGVTLETFTGIIGVVLAGLAIGAWFGGRAADRFEPHQLLGPLLILGGIAALVAPPLVHWLGPTMRAGGPAEILVLSMVGFFLPAAVLSAISPIVVKIRLRSLDQTGSVVGDLSAFGTVGAIFGTFVTGFVLIAALPSRTITAVVGGLLVGIGLILLIRSSRLKGAVTMLLPVAIAGGLLLSVDGHCDTETKYYCAFVTTDPDRASGRVLWLDTVRNSYVDLDDPTYLGFRYAHGFAAVISSLPGGPIDVLSIGGGGFTFPRFVTSERPGSANTVLELDPSVVDMAVEQLGLDPTAMTIRTGDARVHVRNEPAAAYDLVIGDAFSGLAVPWHLTTREFVEDIQERLRPGGIYVMNIIDRPPLGLARAEVATLDAVFEHVGIIAPRSFLNGEAGGNFVVAASGAPLDTVSIEAAIALVGGGEIVITDTATFIDGAQILTDDFAPVDQLISR